MGLFKWPKNKDYDALVTEAIESIQYPPVATEGEFKLYCSASEVGGYLFLNCNIIGPFQVRVKEGCKAEFSNGTEEISIDSETTEIYTDYSDTLSVGVTAFVVELESKLKTWIENGELKNIRFVFRKKSCVYTSIDAGVFAEQILLEQIDEEE